MFGVTEIADAIADEFMGVLQTLDSRHLLALKDDARALRRMLPVGLSCGEACNMIEVILSTQSAA